MAKTKEIQPITSGTVKRDETSKGEFWKYTGESNDFSITQEVKDSDTYIRINNPIAVKNGEGEVLVITKFLNKKTNKVITITDTITNFNDDTTTITSNGNELTADFQYYENITGADSKVTGDWANLYETKKNTTYTIKDNAKSGTSTGSNVNVYDEKGADTYNLNGGLQSDTVYIRDFAGKDTYNVASTSGFNANKLPEIYDYLGNDKYNFGYLEGSKDAMATVFDYKGNDAYKVTKTTNVVNVTDKAGNDNYTIKDSDLSNESGEIIITDDLGNDKYTLTKVISNEGNTDRRTKITDNAGKDTYKITEATNTYISDFNSAKDSYTATNSTNVTIIDSSNITGKTSGNDKYTFTNTKNYSALDYDGNENYTVLGGSGDLSDFAGNDKYKVTAKKDYAISRLTIADTKGKDAYTISGAKATKTDEAVYVQKLTINDSGEILKDAKGKDVKNSANDTYKLSYIDNTSDNSYKITDKAGDDKYAITNSNGIRIEDKAGKDTYTISGTAETKSTDENDVKLLKIVDNSGDDTYKLSYIDNSGGIISGVQNYYVEDTEGNDKYTVSDSYSMNITDKGGNDMFTLKNVSNTYIYSDATTNKDSEKVETNTFNLTNIQGVMKIFTNSENADKLSVDTYNINYTGKAQLPNVNIHDYDNGNDTYNIKSSTELKIDDDGGNDKYSFTKSLDTSTFSVTDNSGDDTYTIDKLKGTYTLDDKAGDKDSLIFADKKANIVFMADINDSKIGRLFAYDTKNGGFVEMLNYFNKSDDTLTADGDGLIETIKVGKKDVTVDTSLINSAQQALAQFYSNTDFTSIEDAIANGTEGNLVDLVACFTKQ